MDNTVSRVRLDVWLDVSCLFRTRSEAQRACKGGKVDVNGERAKPHRDVRLGDRLVIARSGGQRQHVVVRGLEDRHIPKPEARELYEDVTPPPSPEEAQFRDLLRLTRPRRMTSGVPSRRDQRALRDLKRGL